jgi:GxxExxY protein
MNNLLYEELTYKIIGAGGEVHKELGPGYLESVYEDALCYELNELKITY